MVDGVHVSRHPSVRATVRLEQRRHIHHVRVDTGPHTRRQWRERGQWPHVGAPTYDCGVLFSRGRSVQRDHALAVAPLLELRRVGVRLGVQGRAASIEVETALGIVIRVIWIQLAGWLPARAKGGRGAGYLDVFDVGLEDGGCEFLEELSTGGGGVA